MTINEIRDLLVEEYIEVDVSVDLMDALTDGDQFPVCDLTTREVLKAMLKACSEEQVEATRAAIIAARHQEMEDEILPF